MLVIKDLPCAFVGFAEKVKEKGKNRELAYEALLFHLKID